MVAGFQQSSEHCYTVDQSNITQLDCGQEGTGDAEVGSVRCDRDGPVATWAASFN
jgi:hypothetical protein